MRFGTFAALVLMFTGGFAAAQTQTPKAAPPPPPRPAPTSAPAPAASPDETAIKERLAGFVKAYNARNAAGLAEFFTDDATLIDLDGTMTQGKASISAQFAAGFAESSSYTLESTVESLRKITADVYAIDGTSKLTAPNDTPVTTRFSSLIARKDKVWNLAEIRDLPAPQEEIPPADRLAEFDWMVGDWVDQNGDMKIHSTIKWGDNKAFLMRTTTVHVGEQKESSSVMILMWDPQLHQVHSWLFDSGGGRGEAAWTRASENQWIIRAEGTLANGAPTSATQILTLVGKDTLNNSSVDRIIGGEVAPDIDEILMVRKPPAAGGASTTPTPTGGAATTPVR